MNIPRRGELQKIADRLSSILADLESVRDAEEEARDGMSGTNLEATERYAESDQACDNLNTAVGLLEDAISEIESAKSCGE